jgi:hypothetical protein
MGKVGIEDPTGISRLRAGPADNVEKERSRKYRNEKIGRNDGTLCNAG